MLNNRTNSIRLSALPCCAGSRRRRLARVSRSLAQQVPTIPAGPPAGLLLGRRAPPAHRPPPGGAPAAQPEEPPTEAERLIDAAIKKLAKLQSVAADLLEYVDMLDQKFTIKGRYLRAPNARVKLQLTVYGTSRLERHDPSSLRRRNPVGLPAGPRSTVLSQAEHQADPGTAQFTRSRPQDQEPGDHPDGLGWTGDAAGGPAQIHQVRPEGRGRARRQESLEIARDAGKTAKGWSVPTRGRSTRPGSYPLTSRWMPRFIWARKTAGLTG